MRPHSQSELQPDSPEEILHLVKCYICQFHEDNEEENENSMKTRGRERERIWHPSDNVKRTALALGQ